MIEHLSADQISQWIVGDRPLELQEHVAECAECRAELGQLESALAQFRTAMREPAGFVPPPAWRQPEPRPALWFSWPRLVLTATALLVLVAVPVTWRVRNHERAREQAALADSRLLESVDAAISQAVPHPMEPLVSLATWNSSSTELNQKTRRQ
jgi:predicted anti-sigma-YlaC factor YlaD